jgi:hypothetical protein
LRQPTDYAVAGPHQRTAAAGRRDPEPVQQSVALPPPKPAAKVATYSVTVHKAPVQSLLFALARDAGLNVDIHPGIGARSRSTRSTRACRSC